MNEPRKISPMDGDKLDPLSRPPVRIPSFSKLTGVEAADNKPPAPKPAKVKPVSEFAYVIAALRVKRDKLSAAIEALEGLG